MSIGGVDTVLTIPAQVPAGDVIVRVCQLHWPEGVLEDDYDGSVYSLAEAQGRLPSRPEQAFFIYRDADTAKNWDNEGATSKNANAMLHFLINKPVQNSGLREVTVVCDQWDTPMQDLLSELATELHAVAKETSQ